MLPKERLAHDIARDRRELLLVFLDSGKLHFLFARDRFLRHGRVQQNIGEQVRRRV